MCHCYACQQRTGSVFGVQARFPVDKVTIDGSSTTYVRTGDSGGTIAFHFCPVCGTTLFWRPDGLPDYVVVAVGAFKDQTFPPPTVSVYEARRHPWTSMPALAAECID
jgi:hypothetical protein